MSYWVYLRDNNGDLVEVPRHKEGGTVALTGTPEAELNITYNYSKYFYNTLDADDGIRYLDGKQASEVTNLLQKAVARLGTDQTDDYWDEDPGNAGHALSVLLDWANQHPEAEFEVTG
jgi:hypothetical protein